MIDLVLIVVALEGKHTTVGETIPTLSGNKADIQGEDNIQCTRLSEKM